MATTIGALGTITGANRIQVAAADWTATYTSPTLVIGASNSIIACEVYIPTGGGNDVIGTLTVQGSVSGNNWVDLTDDAGDASWAVDTTSATFKKLFNFSDIGFRYFRVVFTRSSGSTGTAEIYATQK